MENLKNKSQNLKSKDYFKRFTKLNIYSYTRPDDKKIYLGADPKEVYSLFNGNTSSDKKEIKKEIKKEQTIPTNVTIDQSAIQYYIILALQDFYQNYHLPLVEENKALRDRLDNLKKKNDERFEFIINSMKCKSQKYV